MSPFSIGAAWIINWQRGDFFIRLVPGQLRITGRMVGRDSQLQPRDRRLRWASGEIYTEHMAAA